jgi:hypothetical protein
VAFQWNGQDLGVFDLDGRQRHTIVVALDGVTASVDNELVIAQQVAGEAPPVIYVDAIEVDYVRSAELVETELLFGGAADGDHHVSGFQSPSVLVYEVSDPARPRRFGEVPVDESGSVRFKANGAERFIAVSPDAVLSPVDISPFLAQSLRSTSHAVDYLIIAASHLAGEAQALADLREADGYRVLLVDIDEVYWAFSDGEPDPLAVRELLSFASESWQTAPRFVTLVGKGNLDYRDILGLGGNWLPPSLAPTDGGLFPSDSMLGDIVGEDGVPEIAIGRLPITSGDELARIVDAIEAFEAGHESMRALFAGDDSERGEFASAAHALAGWATPERTEEVDLNEETLEDARARLMSLWESSLGWVSYVGHSGLDRIATEGLLTSEDVPALAELQSRPMVVGWTCNMVRFDIPGFLSLGEQLINEGSSAGVFSATGWSNHVDTDALRNAFSEAVFASDAETIGDAMLRAHQAASEAPIEMHRVYMLLGDPALRLRAPKAAPEPNPDPDPSPIDDPTDPPAPPRMGADTAPSGSGCEIARPNTGRGAIEFWLWVFGTLAAIRRRRVSRTAPQHLH